LIYPFLFLITEHLKKNKKQYNSKNFIHQIYATTRQKKAKQIHATNLNQGEKVKYHATKAKKSTQIYATK
jgi:hypothetical protein